MPPARAWTDEYTLLCERCGYVVEGLPVQGACPECGKAIAESLPERRVGTAWQKKPSARSLVRTWAATVRTPRRVLDEVSMDSDSAARLLAWTVLSAGGVAFLGAAVTGAATWIQTGRVDPTYSEFWLFNAGSLLGASLFAVVITMLLAWILSGIEARGLRFFGTRRSFRITGAVARVICAHGSVGWLIAATGVSVGAVVQNWDSVAGGVVMVATFLAGFLFFETFAWLGLRRCKYANRARPEGAPSVSAGPAPDGADPRQ